jgi:hypothetical protein
VEGTKETKRTKAEDTKKTERELLIFSNAKKMRAEGGDHVIRAEWKNK